MVILAAKQKSWEVFTTQTDSTSKISKLIRSLNSSNSECLGILKDPTTGEFLDDPLASTNVLLEKFFPKHDKMSLPEFLQTGSDTCLWCWDIDESVFTNEKVGTALQSFSPFKSCGTDDLKSIVFKNLGPKAINFITRTM